MDSTIFLKQILEAPSLEQSGEERLQNWLDKYLALPRRPLNHLEVELLRMAQKARGLSEDEAWDVAVATVGVDMVPLVRVVQILLKGFGKSINAFTITSLMPLAHDPNSFFNLACAVALSSKDKMVTNEFVWEFCRNGIPSQEDQSSLRKELVSSIDTYAREKLKP